MFKSSYACQWFHLVPHISSWRKWGLAVCGGLIWMTSHALEIQRIDSDVFVSGDIVAQDDLKLKAVFEAAPVKRLILVNSRGGHLNASLNIARWLTTQPLTTLVSGPCLSACSLIFMAGKERMYATGFEPRLTVIGIHGPSLPLTGQMLPERAAEMLAFYKERMGHKYDAQLLHTALYEMKDATGFVLVREITRNSPKDRITLHCPTAGTPRWQCTEYPRLDAFTLGLVTTTETVSLQLPDSMRPRMP
ncbi:MAG: ATP-dependent Clp protease proteolytic subunit [Limnohabitans sp.]